VPHSGPAACAAGPARHHLEHLGASNEVASPVAEGLRALEHLLGFAIAGTAGLPVAAPLVSLGAFLAGSAAGGVLARTTGDRHVGFDGSSARRKCVNSRPIRAGWNSSIWSRSVLGGRLTIG
jgi:hypothetical protein